MFFSVPLQGRRSTCAIIICCVTNQAVVIKGGWLIGLDPIIDKWVTHDLTASLPGFQIHPVAFCVGGWGPLPYWDQNAGQMSCNSRCVRLVFLRSLVGLQEFVLRMTIALISGILFLPSEVLGQIWKWRLSTCKSCYINYVKHVLGHF